MHRGSSYLSILAVAFISGVLILACARTYYSAFFAVPEGGKRPFDETAVIDTVAGYEIQPSLQVYTLEAHVKPSMEDSVRVGILLGGEEGAPGRLWIDTVKLFRKRAISPIILALPSNGADTIQIRGVYPQVYISLNFGTIYVPREEDSLRMAFTVHWEDSVESGNREFDLIMARGVSVWKREGSDYRLQRSAEAPKGDIFH